MHDPPGVTMNDKTIPMISEEDALDLARDIAHREGWTWIEPALATWHAAWFSEGGRWEVCSNATGFGAKVRVVLDSSNGVLLSKGFIPL